jgi:hypothetical protein
MNKTTKSSFENAKQLFLSNEINNLEIETLIKENLTDNLSLETIFKGIEP